MLPLSVVVLLEPGDGWFDIYGPFVGLVAIVVFVIVWLLREGRHPALEQIVARRGFASPSAYQGTLVVEEHSASHLILAMSTQEARTRHIWYRWIVGVGLQPNFDKVTFDAKSGRATLSKKENETVLPFSDIGAIRMRERKIGKHGLCVWRLDVITRENKAIPFTSSASGQREAVFEQTAALAKAVGTIASVPVQVFVAGNIWTPGWPPKKS